MKKFIVISDLHAHPWSAFATGEGGTNSRFLRTLQVLEDSLAKAEELDVPWLFAGDLVHTAGHALNPVLSALTEVFGRYSDVPKVACWGNHDARGKGGKIEPQQTVWPTLVRAVPNLTLIDPAATPVTELQGLIIGGAGFQPRPDLLDLSYEGDIGLFHQTVRGSFTPSGHELTEGIERDLLLNRYRVSLVGHVHHAQQIEDPDRPGSAVLIPGSPEHHNFGDHGEHGWWVLSMPDDPLKDPEVEFMPGGSPEFRTVEHLEDVQDDGNFYRVRSVRAGERAGDDVRVLRPEPTTVQSRDLLHGATSPEQVLQAWLQHQPPGEGADLAEYLRVGRQVLEGQDPVRIRPARLTEVRLLNFGSHADTTLKVREGMFLVTGTGADYPSNGAGKTTLVGESIYYLVHGKNTKGQGADEVVRWGEEEMEVSGVIEEPGGNRLRVSRGRKKTGPYLDVEDDSGRWEASGVLEMTRKLQSYLGLTPEIHQSLGYFSQESVMLFASASDGERKNILADLAGLSGYQDAAAAAGETASSLERGAEKLGAVIGAQEDRLWEEQKSVEEAQEAAGRWEEVRKLQVSGLQEALHALTEDPGPGRRAGRLTSILARSESLRARREQDARDSEEERFTTIFREIAERAREGQAALRSVADKLGQEVRHEFGSEDAARGLADSLPQARENLSTLEGSLERARARVTELAGLTGRAGAELDGVRRGLREAREAREVAEQDSGLCQACGQPLPEEKRAEQVGRLTTTLRAWEQEAGEKISRLRDAESEEQGAREEDQRLVERYQQVSRYVSSLEQASSLVSRLQEARARVTEAGGQVDHLEARALEQAGGTTQALIARARDRHELRARHVRRVVARLDESLRQRTEQARTALAETEGAENPHAVHEQSAREREASVREKLRCLRDEKQAVTLLVDVYRYWRQGFSKQGIQSLLLEEVAALFNECRGDIFPLLTRGVYDVQFSTVSQTRSGELRERTEFQVYYHGTPRPYSALSGGQRRRVDLGIMITLAQAVSRWMGVPGILGILTLDEVFGFLDASGSEGLIEALHAVRGQIPTVYAVTHDPGLQALFPDSIHVEQDPETKVSVVAA